LEEALLQVFGSHWNTLPTTMEKLITPDDLKINIPGLKALGAW